MSARTGPAPSAAGTARPSCRPRRDGSAVPAPRQPPDARPRREPERSLVVIAGLPGVGKTTLLRRLSRTSAAQALDSEDVAARLRVLPVPYRLLRPFVHGLHLARVLGVLPSSRPCVLTTDPWTSRLRRGLLRTATAASGRRLVVVLVDGTPSQARDGQRRRGRRLSERRMARHEQRYARQWGDRRSSAADVVLDRDDAVRVTSLAQVLARRDRPSPPPGDPDAPPRSVAGPG